MMLKNLFTCVACAALFSGCATSHTVPELTSSVVALDEALNEAGAAAKAGQGDKAMQILRSAASSHPADKTPWVQMAQLRFDQGSYGEAIVNANEALQRDADDKVAYSILAVSGLRVSSKALAELSQRSNLSGSVRSEAHELARLLRTTLGEEVLVPASAPARTIPKKPPVRRNAPARAGSAGGTFDSLK